MRQLKTPFVFGMLCSFVLACGGAGGSSLGGSSASQRAQDLCTHLDGEEALRYNPGLACVALGSGARPEVQGIQVEVLSFTKITGKDSLPEIQNSTERSRFRGVDNNAVAVEVEYTNTTPVKSRIEARVGLQTGGGDKIWTQPYNSKLLIAQHEGYVDLGDRPELGPSQSKRTIHVFALPAGDEPNSVLQVFGMENRVDTNDPRGRKKDFFTDLYILDLPALQTGS